MSVIYFDTLKHWDLFVPFLSHPEFLRSYNRVIWWESTPDELKEKSRPEMLLHLMEDNMQDLTDEERNEMKNLIELANKHGKKSPYWWSALHDCVEGAALITAPLVKLLLKKEVYIVGISVGNVNHQVVCDTFLEPGKYKVGGENCPVIYDLIYPVYPQYSPEFTEIEVRHSLTLEENNRGMGYWEYYQPKMNVEEFKNFLSKRGNYKTEGFNWDRSSILYRFADGVWDFNVDLEVQIQSQNKTFDELVSETYFEDAKIFSDFFDSCKQFPEIIQLLKDKYGLTKEAADICINCCSPKDEELEKCIRRKFAKICGEGHTLAISFDLHEISCKLSDNGRTAEFTARSTFEKSSFKIPEYFNSNLAVKFRNFYNTIVCEISNSEWEDGN